MVDTRLFIWELVILSTIIYFPVLRKIIFWNKARISKTVFKSISVMTIVSTALQYSYYEEILEFTEFQFLQLLCVLIYFTAGYNSTYYEWECLPTKFKEFNLSIIKKIVKAFNGSDPETQGSGVKFSISTPYRIQYNVEGYIDKEKKESVFFLISTVFNFRIIKAIQFMGFFLIMKALAEDSENITFPLLNFNISSIFAVLVSISLSFILIYFEIQAGNAYSLELPILYTKLLKQSAYDIVHKRSMPDGEIIKDKAQAILDKRKSNLIAEKKSKLQTKIDGVFGEKQSKGIDKETIKRIHLMETVKRILNSTPPWTQVSLEEISKLAKKDEKDVEIVIAGLRELKEVSGIYDIWTKTYSGTSISQWLLTKMIFESDREDIKIENIRVFPDGATEFSFKKKDAE